MFIVFLFYYFCSYKYGNEESVELPDASDHKRSLRK